jgi:hypothetical protein
MGNCIGFQRQVMEKDEQIDAMRKTIFRVSKPEKEYTQDVFRQRR